MQSANTVKLLSSLLVLSTVALAGLGYSQWQSWQTLQSLQLKSAEADKHDLVADPGPGASANSAAQPAARNGQAMPVNPGSGQGVQFASDPWQAMAAMESRMQEMMAAFRNNDPFSQFDSFFANGAAMAQGDGLLAGQPDINVEETPQAYEITITVPDNTQLEVNTSVEGRQLIIEGTLENEVGSQQGAAGSRMYSSSQFSRSMTLSGDVDPLGIENSTREDGILIRVPKKLS